MQRVAEHGDGIALIPSGVGSKWVHKIIFPACDAIFFHEGRIAFLDKDMNPVPGNNSDSMLVAYGERNVEALRVSGLPGKLWEMNR